MLISVTIGFAQSDLKSGSKITVKPANSNTSSSDTLHSLDVSNQIFPDDSLKRKSVDSINAGEVGEPLEYPIVYNARDSIRYETKGQKIYLFGDAYVNYQSMNLKSEFIEIDNAKNTITAYGKKDSLGNEVGTPTFKEGSQEIACRKMVYNLKTKKGKIYDIQTKEGDLILMGSEVKKDSNNVVYMKNLRCIPCEFKDSRTIFRAKYAKIIPNDKIVTGPMYLEIGGVPTPLGLPFGFFPNTKKAHSGILIPTYGNSEALGFYLKEGGFYWGINTRTDMTIRGDIYGNGSFGLKTLNNYNVNYKYNGALSLGFSQFNEGEKEIPSSYPNGYKKRQDISISWKHNQDQKSNPTIRFSSDVNIRTSQYNKNNAINSGQYLTNTFQSNIIFTKTFKASSLSINARHDQNTQTQIMNISFPELTFNINRFYPFKKEGRIKQNALDKIGISYLFEAKNTLSGKENTIFQGNIGDSIKYGARHTLPISTNLTVFKYFTLSPSLNLSAVMYTKTKNKELDYTTNKIISTNQKDFKTGYDANFSTSLSTKLFMDYVFKSKRIKQIRHLLIPALNYTYRPNFGEAQYGFWKDIITDTLTKTKSKYSIFENTLFGGPAIGKQNSLGINLNNSLDAKIRKRTDTGFVDKKIVLIQNLSFSTTYNFAADSFKMSNISMTGRTKIWKFFDVVFASTFDPYFYDATHARRSKNFSINENGKLARFTNGNIALSASFSSNTLQTMLVKKPTLTNAVEQGAVATNTAQSQKNSLPWNLNVYYNINFVSNATTNKLTQIQTLNFSGDIAVTKYWKLGITSGYDFTARNLSYTSFNVGRDLKCWQATINWVPFGFRKSYSISINLKTSMLSDIKIPRQRQWYDN